MAAAVFVISTAYAEEEFDFDDSLFDEVEFEEVEQESSFLDIFKIELGQEFGTSKLADWKLISNETWLLVGWQDSLSTWLYGEFEAQSTINWPVGESIYGTNDETDFDSELNLGYLQASAGPLSAKAGKYTIGWGEIERGGILDIISPPEAITSGDLSSDGTGQFLISSDLYISQWTLSAFYSPKAEYSPGLPEPNENHDEVGFKAATSISNADFGFYLGSFVNNTPMPDPESFFSETRGDEFNLVGMSANYAMGKTLLKLDIAYKEGIDYLTANSNMFPEIIEKNRLDIGVGLEHTRSDDLQLVLMLISQHIIDYEDNLIFFGAESTELQQPEYTSQLMASLSNSYLNEDLNLEVLTLLAANGDLGLVATNIDYTFNDNWRMEWVALTARTDDESIYSFFDEEVLLSASLIYRH